MLATLLQVFVAAFCSAPAYSQTLITQTVGSGSNESFFVLDFNDGAATSSYAFAYRYDGTRTGEDLLGALAAEAGLTVVAQEFPFGPFVVTLGYNGQSRTGGANDYWSYWLSDNGADWVSAGVGVRARTLSNGSWDGWSWAPNLQATPPDVPQIPEPSSFLLVSTGLLGLAGAVVRRRNERSR
jgi:hypothetical protein